MFNKRMEYEIDQQRRNQAMDAAEASRLAKVAQGDPPKVVVSKRRLLYIGMFLLGTLILIGNARNISAQQFEPGAGQFFIRSEVAFTLGCYYYNAERYEEALEKFTEAIDELPEEVLIPGTPYANLYRMLGKTQDSLDLHDEAMKSYKRYLELNTLDPDPAIVELVEATTVLAAN